MSIKKGSRTIASSVPVTEWGSIDGTIADQSDLKGILDSKAETYSPTFTGTPLAPTAPIGAGNNQIATTKYVQDALLNAGSDLPDQTGQSGKFLTTNGQLPSWSNIPAEIPSQSGNSGKFLTTNGTSVSWGNAVTTDTAQTITGNKTIQNSGITSSTVDGVSFTIKSNNQHLGTNPSSNHISSINFTDDSNATVAKFSSIQTSDGWSGFLAGAGSDPTNPHNNMLMIANGNNKLLLVPPTTSHGSCAVRRDFFNTEFAKTVKNTGNETIAGIKTFTTSPVLSVNGNGVGDNRYLCKVTTYEQGGTAVSSNTYSGVSTRDKNGIEMGTAYTGLLTDGSVVSGLFVKKPIEGSTDSAQIKIQYDSEGNVTTSAPTPLVNDNSSQIATTSWVTTKVNGITLTNGNDISIDTNKAINYTGPKYYRIASRTWTYAQWTQYCEKGVIANITPSYTVTGLKAGDLVSVEGICTDRGNANVLAWGVTNGAPAADTNNVSVTFLGLNIQNDAGLVHLAGDETITGTKTFNGVSGLINYKSTNIDKTNAPNSNLYIYTDYLDKNNQRIGVIGSRMHPDGYYGTYLQAGNEASIWVLSNGTNVSTSAPTPAADSNDNNIATTAWVNNKIQLVNALPANPVSGVLYLIPES